MLHHPHVTDRDPLRTTLEIATQSRLAGWIHGTALGCCLLIAYCLNEILRRRVSPALYRATVLLYGAGISALTGAAIVDGWVIESLAKALPHVRPADLQLKIDLSGFC